MQASPVGCYLKTYRLNRAAAPYCRARDMAFRAARKRPSLEKTGGLFLGRYVWKTGYAQGRTVTQWVANGKQPLDLV